VDHIVPKNQGGSEDISNLQALCFRCNAGKRDTDCTDFRSVQASYGQRQEGCVFCALEGSGRVLLENELAVCIADAYPVTEGHSLVIPRREQLSAQDATISGWNVGLNSGEATWQNETCEETKRPAMLKEKTLLKPE
jgi:hypothetical protein